MYFILIILGDVFIYWLHIYGCAKKYNILMRVNINHKIRHSYFEKCCPLPMRCCLSALSRQVDVWCSGSWVKLPD